MELRNFWFDALRLAVGIFAGSFLEASPVGHRTPTYVGGGDRKGAAFLCSQKYPQPAAEQKLQTKNCMRDKCAVASNKTPLWFKA